jgi:hypothetical protein
VRDSNGKMSVATSCGQVRVIGFRGQLDAKTSEGNIYLEGEFEKLAARAADGTVIPDASGKCERQLCFEYGHRNQRGGPRPGKGQPLEIGNRRPKIQFRFR